MLTIITSESNGEPPNNVIVLFFTQIVNSIPNSKTNFKQFSLFNLVAFALHPVFPAIQTMNSHSNAAHHLKDVDNFAWIEQGPSAVRSSAINHNEDQNIQPSAPPEPSNQQHVMFQPGNPQDMILPDAIAQQLIYQQIMEEQRKQRASAIPQSIIEEKKQDTVPQNHSISAMQSEAPQARSSYLAQSMDYRDTLSFKESYLCIWRPKENGKGIEIMMGLQSENKSYTFFGGKRDESGNRNSHPMDCALFKFHEQTGRILDKEPLAQVLMLNE